MRLGNLRVCLCVAVTMIAYMGCNVVRAEQVLSAGGWTITAANGIALVTDGVSDGTLILEKEAAFSTATPLAITFMPTGGQTQVSSIEITDEVINNISGTTWTGFDFLLTGPAAFTSEFAAPGSQQGGDFSTVAVTPTKISYGGSQPSGAVPMFWGQDVSPLGGELVFGPIGDAGFTLFEVPITSTVSVPLPAAAWQTLACVGLIGLIGVARKMWRSKRTRRAA